MRSYSPLALATMIAVASAAPAFAQEDVPQSFSGPHVEAMMGYDNLSGGDDGTGEFKDGFGYGIALGYDYQIGQAVIGVEGEWSDSTTRLRANDIGVAGDSVRLDTDRDLYIGARLGYVVAPKTMLYVKGGYTNAMIETEYNDGTDVFNTSPTMDGWRIGAGVEQQFNLLGPKGFARLEYRYSNYSNLDLNDAEDNELSDIEIDVDRSQVMVGVGVRF